MGGKPDKSKLRSNINQHLAEVSYYRPTILPYLRQIYFISLSHSSRAEYVTIVVWASTCCIFTAVCICVILSTSCILIGAFHLHHVTSCHIYHSSFYMFLGQPCGCIWYAQPHSYLTLPLYAPSAPLPLVNSYFLVQPPLVVCF